MDISNHQREVCAAITAFRDYASDRGYDVGTMRYEHRYRQNPETGRYYSADIWLEYKGKMADVEDDANHGKRKEADKKRDLVTTSAPNTQVIRFITKGKNNIAIDTAKCYMLEGKRDKRKPESVSLTDDDRLTIFSALNEFYGFCFNEKAVLKFFYMNHRYELDFFLIEEEIEAMKDKMIEEIMAHNEVMRRAIK